MGRSYIERSCVPYGNSFAVVGGDSSTELEVGTIWLFDPAAETFVMLDERLSQPKSSVAAFAVSEDMFPPCQ